MWNIIRQIPMIRYLIVLRINKPIVFLPTWLPAEVSLVLGTLIADRLPVQWVRQWRKALAVWKEDKRDSTTHPPRSSFTAPPPEASWPIETVWFPYPRKRHYHSGERILLEFKIIGEEADHGFFLESVLPVLEAAGYRIDTPWYRQDSLWGRYEIAAVYVGRGRHWEPLVQNGRLDLRYQASVTQWIEGMDEVPPSPKQYSTLNWVTPFDGLPYGNPSASELSSKNNLPPVPHLRQVLDATVARIASVLPGKRNDMELFWEGIAPADAAPLQEAFNQAETIGQKDHSIVPPPKGFPGQGIGSVTFNDSIPPILLPLLDIGSILHVGRQTHIGCGTFYLT